MISQRYTCHHNYVKVVTVATLKSGLSAPDTSDTSLKVDLSLHDDDDEHQFCKVGLDTSCMLKVSSKNIE